MHSVPQVFCLYTESLFWTLHINGIVQYLGLPLWLVSLSTCRGTHVLRHPLASFLLPAHPLVHTSTLYLSIHRLMDTWVVSRLGLVWLTLVWASTYKSLCKYIFISNGQIPTSGITSSYSNFVFNFLRNYQVIFQGSCITEHSHILHFIFPTWPVTFCLVLKISAW